MSNGHHVFGGHAAAQAELMAQQAALLRAQTERMQAELELIRTTIEARRLECDARAAELADAGRLAHELDRACPCSERGDGTPAGGAWVVAR